MMLRFLVLTGLGLFMLASLAAPQLSQARDPEKDQTFDVYVGFELPKSFNPKADFRIPATVNCQGLEESGGGCAVNDLSSMHTLRNSKLSKAFQVGVYLPKNFRVDAEALFLRRQTTGAKLDMSNDASFPDSIALQLMPGEVNTDAVFFNVYYDYNPSFITATKRITTYIGGGVGAATTEMPFPSLSVQQTGPLPGGSATGSMEPTAAPLTAVRDGNHMYQFIAGVDVPVWRGFSIGAKARFMDSLNPGFQGLVNKSDLAGVGQVEGWAWRDEVYVRAPDLNRTWMIGVQVKLNPMTWFRD